MFNINCPLKLILLFTITLSICSCKRTSFDIIDYYKIYRYAENGTGDSNVLMCKLGARSDPYIQDVKVIEWNQTYMFVETFKEYYLVDGSKNKLCCMCRNVTKGPYKLKDIKLMKDSLQFEPINKIEVYKYMLKE